MKDKGCPFWNKECTKSDAIIRAEVLDEIWRFCISLGVEDHKEIVGAPDDKFFALKLLKKIAEMRYDTIQQIEKEDMNVR